MKQLEKKLIAQGILKAPNNSTAPAKKTAAARGKAVTPKKSSAKGTAKKKETRTGRNDDPFAGLFDF